MSDGCKETIYSYSRIGSFKNCPYSYNLSYNEDDRGLDSIYTFMGSAVHELLEKLQLEEIDNNQAMLMFMDKLDEAEMIGLEFMSESVRDKYIENITHYLATFVKARGEFFIEEEFLITIAGYKLRGFIDIYFKYGNKIAIFDYKTSSKFAKKDLIPNGRQLVLYAMALEQKYPGCEIEVIGWDMLKYVIVEGQRGPKLIERRELQGQEYGKAIVYHRYDDETKQDCINYIITGIREIEMATEFPPLDIRKEYFYCKNLCGHKHLCEHYKKLYRY